MTDKKHNHYFKDVSNLDYIDVYRTLKLFNVTDPCLQHAAKKILVAGNRGHKDLVRDVKDIIDSCQRFLDMYDEDDTTLVREMKHE